MPKKSIVQENEEEEIRDIVDKCVECGFCKQLCPVFKIIREETYSPRGKTIALKKEIYDKVLYSCTLCKSCEIKCPLGLKISDAIKRGRKILVLQNQETENNKEMIKNIRDHGNPFGKEKTDGKKLYCC